MAILALPKGFASSEWEKEVPHGFDLHWYTET